MNREKVSFNLNRDVIAEIDRMAAEDNRDRTSMVRKIIAFYFKHHPNPDTTPTQRKAGAR